MGERTDEQKSFAAMDAATKRKWLSALRSGKYRRAKMQLKNRGGYCCLGVLCETMHWEYDAEADEPASHLTRRVGLSQSAINALMRINDGTLHEGEINEQLLAHEVKSYKAGAGAPFRSIADFIEKKL